MSLRASRPVRGGVLEGQHDDFGLADIQFQLALLRRPPAPGQDEVAALDLEVQRIDLHSRHLGGDDGARWIGGVGDVDRRREAPAAPRQAAALEDVTEQLVHLAPHPVEVGKDVVLRHKPQVRGWREDPNLQRVDGSLPGELHLAAEGFDRRRATRLRVQFV